MKNESIIWTNLNKNESQHQQTTDASHYPSQPVETSFKNVAMISKAWKNSINVQAFIETFSTH